jgi:hypothetical protein
MAATIVERDRNSGIWAFAIINAAHNYLLTTAFSAYNAIRKMYKNKAFKKKIAAYKLAGMELKHIYTADVIEDFGNPLIYRDYYNERARIAREKLRGRSFIQALLETLTAQNINNFKAEWSTDFRTEFGDDGGSFIYFYISHIKYRKLLA